MDTILLTAREVDVILRYPSGRTQRLARGGSIASIVLPDGEIRITQQEVDRILGNISVAQQVEVANASR